MSWIRRTSEFCDRFDLQMPILLAPMAGVPAPSLSIEVMRAGGMGACGALLMSAKEIRAWVSEVRAAAAGPLQLNLWIPDPGPTRDRLHEAKVRDFLENFGPRVPEDAADAVPPDFPAQCQALLDSGAPILSSVMGLFPEKFVQELKAQNRTWFAVVTTVEEAVQAESAGADVIIAQGMEAGGHRAAFRAEEAERRMVGLLSLVPAIVDAVKVPVVATGGIADARGTAAAMALGASAVQIGTGFLRCPEAAIHPAWAAAIGKTLPEDTIVSRAFSGRAGRSIATSYVRAATSADAPTPAPYPVQRGLTQAMRSAAIAEGDVDRMQAWAGQSASLAKADPAAQLAAQLWRSAQDLLP